MDNNSDHDAVSEYVGNMVKGLARKSADELAYRFAGPLGPVAVEGAVQAYHAITDDPEDRR